MAAALALVDGPVEEVVLVASDEPSVGMVAAPIATHLDAPSC
ncbi:MAG: hypothetical protein ACR2HR_02085 [Euzebya sp.]